MTHLLLVLIYPRIPDMNYEPFNSESDRFQRMLKAMTKLIANLLNEIARMRRQFGVSHESIDHTVRSEGIGTREAFTIGCSSVLEGQRIQGLRSDGGMAEILEELRDMRSMINSMASVLAYHTRMDPRDYEHDEDELAEPD
jgi:hypothetical protein